MKIGKLKKVGISLLTVFMLGTLLTANMTTTEAADDDNPVTINMFNYNAMDNSEKDFNRGINYEHTLKFTNGDPKGIGYPAENDYNFYTGGAYVFSNIVRNKLVNGYPFVNKNTPMTKSEQVWTGGWHGGYETITTSYTEDSKAESLAYLFDDSTVYGKSITKNVTDLLNVSGDHYWYNSAEESATLSGNKIIKGKQNGGFWPYGNKDYHFGMTMTASFTMPSDKKVIVNNQSKDMIFSFSGDDDVWVFIDDALVLDLGGIHGTVSGEINFTTGEIKIENEDIGKTVADMLREAGIDESYIDGKTLSTSAMHRINFYYLERGKGDSNCKLDMYLPFVKTKDVTVSKDVEGINDTFKDDYEFTFETSLTGGNSSSLSTLAYEKYDSNKKTDEGTITKINGKYSFVLKDDEYIVLKNIQDDCTLDVKETNANGSGTELAKFSTKINGNNNNSKDSRTFAGKVAEINEKINYVNTLQNQYKGNLTINKTFEGEATADEFDLDVKIGKTNSTLETYQGNYIKNEDNLNGNISKIKNNDTIVIEDIPVDYSYSVNENLTADQSLKYIAPVYTNNTGTIYSQGITVTIQNKLFTSGELQIIKSITNQPDIDFTDGDPIFMYEITNNTTNEKYYQYIRFSKGEDGNISSSVLTPLTDLKAGEYIVKELSTLRYAFDSGNYYYNDNSNESVSFYNKSVTITINAQNQKATVNYNNKVKSTYFDSDNGILINKFNLENGTIKIQKDKLDS